MSGVGDQANPSSRTRAGESRGTIRDLGILTETPEVPGSTCGGPGMTTIKAMRTFLTP